MDLARRIALVGATVLVAACAPAEVDRGEPAPPRDVAGSPTQDDAPDEGSDLSALFEAEPEVVVTGLEAPWSIGFLERGRFLVTERPGRVRLVDEDGLDDDVVHEVPAAATGEGGLLGLVLHPEYPDDDRIYLYYTHDQGGLQNRVAAFELAAEGDSYSLGRERVILDGIPAAANHDGGRLAFGPDDHLYVTTGDAANPGSSADPSSLAGKILRLTADGEPAGAGLDAPEVWAYGLRNPQGLAWDDEGRLYVSDHGPSGEFGLCCKDELNLVEEAAFYGWPMRSGGEDTGVGDPPEEPVDPVAESGGDTWAPSGIAFVPGDGSGSIAVANLRGAHLRRFVIEPGAPEEIQDQEAYLDDLGRLRDVALGPDDCLYVLTHNRDGRGDPREGDDQIVRLCA